MALYTRLLILVNTPQEAEAINSDVDRTDIFYDHFAIPYGFNTNGMRYEAVEIRYDGVRNMEYERYVAQGLRYDLRRGFDN